MSTSDADGLRQALRRHMAFRNVTVNSWSKQAGITEGTLRNFLAGRSESLTTTTLNLLAKAAGIKTMDFFSDQFSTSVGNNTRVFLMGDFKQAIYNMNIPEDPRYPGANRFGVISQIYDDFEKDAFEKNKISVFSQYKEINRVPSVGDRVLCFEEKEVSCIQDKFNLISNINKQNSYYNNNKIDVESLRYNCAHDETVDIKIISEINGKKFLVTYPRKHNNNLPIALPEDFSSSLAKEIVPKISMDNGAILGIFGVAIGTYILE